MQDVEGDKGALSRIGLAARVILGLLLLAMVVLNVANAISRYLLSSVVIGIDELLVFAMIWMVMIGMLLVTAERSHIALEIITGRVAVACASAAWQSYKFVSRVVAIKQPSMARALPMFSPHGAITLGLAGTALVAAVLAWRDALRLVRPPVTERSVTERSVTEPGA